MAKGKESGKESEYSRVPSLFDDSPAAGYPDWRKADTLVVTVGLEGYPPNRTNHLAKNAYEARQLVKRLYGRILEEQSVPGRHFFRVRKP